MSDLMHTLCGCGREARYSLVIEGKEIMSCNKRVVCITYEECQEKLKELQRLYGELLLEVEKKISTETRHEAALRYIRSMQ